MTSRDPGHPRTMWWSVVLAALFAVVPHLPADGQSAQEPPRVEYRPSPRVRVSRGITYARYDATALKLDLYVPAGGKRPVAGVIAVRGGGWLVNDPAEFAHIAAALAERGIAAASIQYRLASEAPFPGAVQDVKAAVRWMRANAAAYGIDPDALGVIGGSSGAMTVLLAALTEDPGFEGHGGHSAASSRVRGVVAMAAPTDMALLSEGARRTVARFLGVAPGEAPERWRDAAPITHIDRSDPPVLLLHSRTDMAVVPQHSIAFADRYAAAGAKSDLVIFDDAPHAFWNYQPWFTQTMDRAAAFFARMR